MIQATGFKDGSQSMGVTSIKTSVLSFDCLNDHPSGQHLVSSA